MMELWKRTFHDSDDYIRLVFDQYFSLSNARFVYNDLANLDKKEARSILASEGVKLKSSMLAIPYRLLLDGKRFKGRYMCGLATEPEFRNQGLMSDMIRRLIRDAEDENLDFLFLIPANAHLREYYAKFGFENAFPISINMQIERGNATLSNSVRIENFKTIDSLIEKNGFSDSPLIHQICDYIIFKEQLRDPGGILHSYVDLESAIREVFLSSGRIYMATDPLGRIVGIFLLYEGEEIKIYYFSADSNLIKEGVLSRIKMDFPNKKVIVTEPLNSKEDVSEKESPDIIYKGMIKFLKKGGISENLKDYKGGELSLMLD